MKRWADMTARERDAIVAEKVMGWTQLKWGFWCDMGVGRYIGVDPKRPDDALFNNVPKYSTDISAAWEVVEKLESSNLGEKMYAPGEFYKYVRTTLTHTPKRVKACVQTDGYSYRGEARAAPEAICVAALRAVGVSI